MSTPLFDRLRSHCQRLRLHRLEAELPTLLEQAAKRDVPYSDFLDELLALEIRSKSEKHLTMRVSMARFPFQKTLDAFDFKFQPSIDPKVNVTIPEHEQDPHLVQKLEEELPGILNWALEGLVRFRRNGRFTQPSVCVQALEEYRKESNPAGMFLSDRCESGPSKRVVCETLYSSYASWCQDHGYRPLNARGFGKEVRRAFKKVERRRHQLPDGRRVWRYEGIGLVQGMWPTVSPEVLPEETAAASLAHLTYENSN